MVGKIALYKRVGKMPRAHTNRHAAKKVGKQTRAARACLSCRSRRIRCNVVEGAPCSNCKWHGVECDVPRYRKNRGGWRALSPVSIVSAEPTESEQTSSNRGSVDEVTRTEHVDSEAALPQQDQQRSSSSASSPLIESNETDPIFCNLLPSFTNPSSYSFDLLECSAPVTTTPAFLEPPSGNISAEHLSFLETQGALRLPSFALQCALIQAYVEFAYPYMPMLHLQDVLSIINDGSGSTGRISLVLYQAILFAGSGFVNAQALTGSEFASRKLLRKDLSKRISLLYDLGYEQDDTILIQVALLMSSGCDIPQDRKDSWHWMGVAATLAYAMELHRESSYRGRPLREQKHRKRIWWTCYMRDRFLALGMRRPTRLKDEDSNVPGLEITDFEVFVLPNDNMFIGSGCTVLRDTDRQLELAELSVHRSRLCVLINSILQLQDRLERPQYVGGPAKFKLLGELEKDGDEIERSLKAWQSALPSSSQYHTLDRTVLTDGSAPIAVHRSHLHMTYHTAVYTLQRPRFLPSSPAKWLATSKRASEIAGAKLLSSIFSITRMAEELHELGLDSYLPVTGVTIIFPAIVIHLLEMKSRNRVLRERAICQYLACMRVMETLQQTYTAADMTMSYMKAAMHKACIDLPSHDRPYSLSGGAGATPGPATYGTSQAPQEHQSGLCTPELNEEDSETALLKLISPLQTVNEMCSQALGLGLSDDQPTPGSSTVGVADLSLDWLHDPIENAGNFDEAIEELLTSAES